jgi:hypothetical protein
MASPLDRLPDDLRRPATDHKVAEDGLQHLTIMVAALTGRITRRQAANAIGYTANDLTQSITNAGLAGEELVRAAIAGRFVYVGLWAYHARQAQARDGARAEHT